MDSLIVMPGINADGSIAPSTSAATIRTNLGLGTGDAVTFGNLTISDLTVNGTTTTVNSATITVDDPLIRLGDNNPADVIDLGFFGLYVSSGSKYAGLFRDASDGKFKLFVGLAEEPTTTVNTAGSGYTAGTLVVGVIEASTFTGLPEAGAATAGIVTTGSQTLAGNKTFTGVVTVGGLILPSFASIIATGGCVLVTDGNSRIGLGYTGKGLQVGNELAIGFSPISTIDGSYSDAAFKRGAAGLIYVVNAEDSTYRDLKARNLFATTKFQIQDLSSTGTVRERADIQAAAIDNTDATRKYRAVHNAYDTAQREYARGWADGSVGRAALASPTTAPTDAHLANGQISFYLDEAGNNLKVHVKYSDGTIKTGTVALT